MADHEFIGLADGTFVAIDKDLGMVATAPSHDELDRRLVLSELGYPYCFCLRQKPIPRRSWHSRRSTEFVPGIAEYTLKVIRNQCR